MGPGGSGGPGPEPRSPSDPAGGSCCRCRFFRFRRCLRLSPAGFPDSPAGSAGPSGGIERGVRARRRLLPARRAWSRPGTYVRALPNLPGLVGTGRELPRRSPRPAGLLPLPGPLPRCLAVPAGPGQPPPPRRWPLWRAGAGHFRAPGTGPARRPRITRLPVGPGPRGRRGAAAPLHRSSAAPRTWSGDPRSVLGPTCSRPEAPREQPHLAARRTGRGPRLHRGCRGRPAPPPAG